ncbi:superoxide dismutase family protein [Blastomonas sp. AAP53]|uniref:superoxide dismutase family protein n=1 Tax=Blastomonas sp. AAP53 TaxID=1248760 RepID=UPI0002EC95E9|nr:superoxide dismutase family protein [Blastomonas sp. AAP53]
MTPIHTLFGATILAGASLLAGCSNDTQPAADTTEVAAPQQPATGTPPMTLTAMLKTADGMDAGTATATERDDGIAITVTATNMTAGERGIHVHTTGKCEGPKFESAGGHWNPTGAQHGLSNPQGQHHGDMPNLTVPSDGSGKLDYVIRDAQIAEMQDADGAALVIHAKFDDQMTDPSGNSGDRIACGVFTRG